MVKNDYRPPFWVDNVSVTSPSKQAHTNLVDMRSSPDSYVLSIGGSDLAGVTVVGISSIVDNPLGLCSPASLSSLLYSVIGKNNNYEN